PLRGGSRGGGRLVRADSPTDEGDRGNHPPVPGAPQANPAARGPQLGLHLEKPPREPRGTPDSGGRPQGHGPGRSEDLRGPWQFHRQHGRRHVRRCDVAGGPDPRDRAEDPLGHPGDGGSRLVMKGAVVPSTDERFLRLTRNEQVRRRRRNRSLLKGATWVGLHLGGLGVVALSAWGGYHYLTHSDRFSVRQVLVSGGSAAPAAQIKLVTDRSLGRNIFATDLEALQQKLESQPWIRTASVKRRIPDALLIQIEERVPEVLVKMGSSLYLADGEGVLLDRFG